MSILSNIGNSFESLLPASAPTTYVNPAAQTTGVDVQRVVSSIKGNETGGIQNPYSFHQPSGSKAMGNANGAYQITDGELKTYAPRFLGRAVTPQQFLSDPSMQDTYMSHKVMSLANRKLSAPQIMAVHRGGMSDLTPEGISSMQTKYASYVHSGMLKYSGQQDTAAEPLPPPAQLSSNSQ